MLVRISHRLICRGYRVKCVVPFIMMVIIATWCIERLNISSVMDSNLEVVLGVNKLDKDVHKSKRNTDNIGEQDLDILFSNLELVLSGEDASDLRKLKRKVLQKQPEHIHSDNAGIGPLKESPDVPSPILNSNKGNISPSSIGPGNTAVDEPTNATDILFSVKTTLKNHQRRLDVMLETWMPQVLNQVFIFTDGKDDALSKNISGHLVLTHCGSSHSREDLNCKMDNELKFAAKFQDRYRWLCFLDDDLYVNIPAMVEKLRLYDHRDMYYIGNPTAATKVNDPKLKESERFWFSGGQFCLSQALTERLTLYLAKNSFSKHCGEIRYPDDVCLAQIVYSQLDISLTVVPEMMTDCHGKLSGLKPEKIPNMIVMSYGHTQGKHHVKIPISGFTKDEDPTRLRTVHCFLNPHEKMCEPLKTREQIFLYDKRFIQRLEVE